MSTGAGPTLVAVTNENLNAEVPALQTRKATLEREVNEIKGQAERLLDGVGLEGSEGEVFLKEKLSELGKRRAGLKTTIAELEISIHGRPAPEEVLEKLRAPGIHSPRRSERSTWLPTRSATRTVLRSESENFKMFSGRILFGRKWLRGTRPVT